MVDLMHRRLLNSLFFGIPLLYYVRFNSPIIFILSLGEIYLSFGIPLITSSAILLPIKSPVAIAVSFTSSFSKSFTYIDSFIH